MIRSFHYLLVPVAFDTYFHNILKKKITMLLIYFVDVLNIFSTLLLCMNILKLSAMENKDNIFSILFQGRRMCGNEPGDLTNITKIY